MLTQTEECGVRKEVFRFSAMGLPELKGRWVRLLPKFIVKWLQARTILKFLERELIPAAGMNPARRGRIDFYPYRGLGGEGFTVYKPLTDSYCIADVYTNLGRVDIDLSTCKPERVNTQQILNLLACRFGSAWRVEK